MQRVRTARKQQTTTFVTLWTLTTKQHLSDSWGPFFFAINLKALMEMKRSGHVRATLSNLDEYMRQRAMNSSPQDMTLLNLVAFFALVLLFRKAESRKTVDLYFICIPATSLWFPSGVRQTRTPSESQRPQTPSGVQRTRPPSGSQRLRSPSGVQRARPPLGVRRLPTPLGVR